VSPPCTKRSQLCEIKLVGKVEKEGIRNGLSCVPTSVRLSNLYTIQFSTIEWLSRLTNRPFSPRQKQPTLLGFTDSQPVCCKHLFTICKTSLTNRICFSEVRITMTVSPNIIISFCSLICASFYCALGVAWNGAILHLLLLFWAVDWL
jgi:hypothetical protein